MNNLLLSIFLAIQPWALGSHLKQSCTDAEEQPVQGSAMLQTKFSQAITFQTTQDDIKIALVEEQPLTQEGFTNMQEECCLDSFDYYSRRTISNMGLEICDEGCHNGFIPFFYCGQVLSLQEFEDRILTNSQEECACYASERGCSDGGMPATCLEKNVGQFNPTWHRRRACNGLTTPGYQTSQAETTQATSNLSATPTTTTTATRATCESFSSCSGDKPVNKGSSVQCSGSADSCDASTCCEARATCENYSLCSGDKPVNKGSSVQCSGNSDSCDASTCCEAKATCESFSSCSEDKPVNKGSSVQCSGSADSCDASTCCEAKATCESYSLCSGDKPVNKGSNVQCSGSADSCDASTCCEAKATCESFSSCSEDKPVTKGSNVQCSGNADSCDTSTCCEAQASCESFTSCSGDNPLNKGSSVLCSGGAESCDAITCCEAAPSSKTTPSTRMAARTDQRILDNCSSGEQTVEQAQNLCKRAMENNEDLLETWLGQCLVAVCEGGAEEAENISQSFNISGDPMDTCSTEQQAYARNACHKELTKYCEDSIDLLDACVKDVCAAFKTGDPDATDQVDGYCGTEEELDENDELLRKLLGNTSSNQSDNSSTNQFDDSFMVCGSSANVNDFSSTSSMEEAGWSFSREDFQKYPPHYSTGVPAGSFWGNVAANGALEIQRTLLGNGSVTVVFGNQWYGRASVFLNNVLKSQAREKEYSKSVTFSFTNGDILKIGEYGYGVLILTSVEFACAQTMPRNSAALVAFCGGLYHLTAPCAIPVNQAICQYYCETEGDIARCRDLNGSAEQVRERNSSDYPPGCFFHSGSGEHWMGYNHYDHGDSEPTSFDPSVNGRLCCGSMAITPTTTTTTRPWSPVIPKEGDRPPLQPLFSSDTPVIIDRPSNPRSGICKIFGDPHIRVFDAPKRGYQSMYRTGVFWIVKSDSVWIQGYYESAHKKRPMYTHVRKLAIGGPFLQGNTLMLEPTKIWWNGDGEIMNMGIDGEQSWTGMDGKVKVAMNIGSTKIKAYIDLPTDNILISVTIKLVGRNIIPLMSPVTLRATQITGQDGHCGNFNGIANDDLPDYRYEVEQKEKLIPYR